MHSMMTALSAAYYPAPMKSPVITEDRIPFERFRHPPGYGPGIAFERCNSRVLVTIESGGFASRLAGLDLATGAVTVGGTVMGELRDAFCTADRQLWVLCTHGLYLVEPMSLAVVMAVKVPKYLHRLISCARGKHVAIAQPNRVRTPVLDLATRTIRSITCPTPDVGIDHAESTWLLSFWGSEAREFDRALRPTGSRRALPRGVTAWRDRDLIYFVAASPRQHPGVDPSTPTPWVVAEPELCAFSLTTWSMTKSAQIRDLRAIIGLTVDKLVVALAAHQQLLLIEEDTLNVICSYELAETPIGLAMAGPRTLTYRTRGPALYTINWR